MQNGMTNWGPSFYGDPCRECGFGWSLSITEGLLKMATLPAAFAEALSGATGDERHPDLTWSTGAYVSHVADNLRIWTERLMGVALGAGPVIGGYDESELARARNYELIPIQAALWSLRLSATEWCKAVEISQSEGTLLIHPERGELDLTAVVLSNTHDAQHHLWDIARTLRITGPEAPNPADPSHP
jgi:hypothetical protein